MTTLDYDTLCRSADIRQPEPLVFRVYTESSASVLVPLTADPSNTGISGFFAPRPSMHLSKAAYLDHFGHLRKGGWARKKGLGASMVAHILNTQPDHLDMASNRVDWSSVPPEDLSPWISATRSLDFALWDVARRLAKGEKVVKLAVIRQSKGADAGGWEWQHRGKRRSIRGAEVWTLATGEIGLERGKAPRWEQHHWDRAHRRVLASDEILYYGRIFGESIVADMTFTRQTLPFALPTHLLRPDISDTHVDHARGWLSMLRWDPPYTDWAQTQRRISSHVVGKPSICPLSFVQPHSPDLPPPYTEATLLSPERGKVSDGPSAIAVGAVRSSYQDELGCIIWPRSLIRDPCQGETRGQVPTGMSADILDLAWSAFELRPTSLVDL